jgi:hypothetical protein
MRNFDIYKNMFKNQTENTDTCLHNEWNQHLGMDEDFPDISANITDAIFGSFRTFSANCERPRT